MNLLQLLVVVLLTPVVIIGGWLLVVLISDAIRPGPQVCRCGRHVVGDNQHIHDQTDGQVHARAVCQPIAEWVSPFPWDL